MDSTLSRSISLKINGRALQATVDVRHTLADFLRHQLELTGTHLGHSRIRTRAFETLTVSSDPDLPLAADGEFLGYARQLKLSVLPGALAVVGI